MKVTIYELIKLIKEDKAPKKIKLNDEEYDYYVDKESGIVDYACIDTITEIKSYLSSVIGNNYINDMFTTEVEIIEEEKDIEELELISYEEFKTMTPAERYNVTAIEYDKINELVREVNKLRKEIEDNL